MTPEIENQGILPDEINSKDFIKHLKENYQKDDIVVVNNKTIVGNLTFNSTFLDKNYTFNNCVFLHNVSFKDISKVKGFAFNNCKCEGNFQFTNGSECGILIRDFEGRYISFKGDFYKKVKLSWSKLQELIFMSCFFEEGLFISNYIIELGTLQIKLKSVYLAKIYNLYGTKV